MTSTAGPNLEATEVVRIDPRTGKRLLDHVSLSVQPGDRIAIVGPTGAGKSVLLRALCLLDSIQSGALRWQRETIDAADIPAFRSRVIFVAQRPALFDGTVEQNLQQPMSMRVHRQREFNRGRIVAWLDALGQSPEFLRKSADDLSGGEQQIVGLLRALQLDPQVLMLDEPTASLDRATAAAVERLISEWETSFGGSRSIIWVSHDPQQAARIATRRIEIEAGRIKT